MQKFGSDSPNLKDSSDLHGKSLIKKWSSPRVRPRNSSSPKPTNRVSSHRLSNQLSAEPLKRPAAQGGQLELHDQICQMLHKVPRQSLNLSPASAFTARLCWATMLGKCPHPVWECEENTLWISGVINSAYIRGCLLMLLLLSMKPMEKITFLKGFLVHWRHSCKKFGVLFRGLSCELHWMSGHNRVFQYTACEMGQLRAVWR